ncbi:SDR family NAD(P)-dependent oxidoreductase [Actinosynnema sp. CA-299493]
MGHATGAGGCRSTGRIRIALVTGAARGIGAAVVDGLVRAGASVAAVDVDPNVRLRRGDRVTPFVADVADAEAVARVVDEVERDLGPVGIGVSVAGCPRLP